MAQPRPLHLRCASPAQCHVSVTLRERCMTHSNTTFLTSAASSDRCTPANPRLSSPTPVSVGRGDPRCQVHSPSFAPPPAASTSTIVAALPRVLSPEPARSGTSSSVLKPVAGTLPANGPIFVSILRTFPSPFAEECPNSDCLNLGAQSK